MSEDFRVSILVVSGAERTGKRSAKLKFEARGVLRSFAVGPGGTPSGRCRSSIGEINLDKRANHPRVLVRLRSSWQLGAKVVGQGGDELPGAVPDFHVRRGSPWY